jgi:3D (Asp-Asp-Asp) domain-containing protein
LVTEYFPIREAWFRGRTLPAPGLTSQHRVDWLYGAHGVAMNGEGIGLDGRVYHFAGPYNLSWVNAGGAPTLPCWNGHWTRGKPVWYGSGWRNAFGQVTFPLPGGGWSNQRAVRLVHLPRPAQFSAGPSLPLDYWKRVAVDPKLIPLGSRVFIPAYCRTPAHGWFTAGDVGGAIIARHVDVFRAPPAALADTHALWNQTIFVIPPGTTPQHPPRCSS